MVEPVLALERGGPGGPPFYASGDFQWERGSTWREVFPYHVFLVALVVPLGFIAPLMKVSEAMEQVSMIKGNLEQVTAFLKTPELVRPTEPAELGERCYQLRMSILLITKPKFSTVSHSRHSPVHDRHSWSIRLREVYDCQADGRFLGCTSGTVHFGGQDIRSIPFGQLMGEISYVAQDNFLFDKSIRENIRMGNPDASDEEVEAAAKPPTATTLSCS